MEPFQTQNTGGVEQLHRALRGGATSGGDEGEGAGDGAGKSEGKGTSVKGEKYRNGEQLPLGQSYLHLAVHPWQEREGLRDEASQKGIQ